MGWKVQGLNHGRSKWFFCSPNHPDWLWSLPSFLFIWYQCSFLEAKHGGMMLITHLYLVMRLRMTGVLPLLLPSAFMAWTMTTLLCNVTNTVHHQRALCFNQWSNGLWVQRSGVISQQGCWDFFYPCHAYKGSGKSYPPLGVRGCFCGCKAARVYTVYDSFPPPDH